MIKWSELFGLSIVGCDYSYIGAETWVEWWQEEDLFYWSPYMMKMLNHGLKGLAANGWDAVKQLLHLLTLYLGVMHGWYLTLWEMATRTLTAGIREMTGGGSWHSKQGMLQDASERSHHSTHS